MKKFSRLSPTLLVAATGAILGIVAGLLLPTTVLLVGLAALSLVALGIVCGAALA